MNVHCVHEFERTKTRSVPYSFFLYFSFHFPSVFSASEYVKNRELMEEVNGAKQQSRMV